MSRSYNHKLECKFRNKILPNGKKSIAIEFMELAKYYPRKLRKKWNRANFRTGYYKHKRNIKKLKEISLCSETN
jgi:hypothetical protein